MIRHLPLVAVAALVGLSACTVPVRVPAPRPAPIPEPMPAPVVNPQSAKERFVTAVEANGCTFNSGNSDAILAAATLSEGDLGGILTELRAEGRGSIAPGGQGFQLSTGVCA